MFYHTSIKSFVSGNSNLVYTIIRKRQVFHSLASLPTDGGTINKTISKKPRRHLPSVSSNADLSEQAEPEAPSMEGSRPAQPAEPGTLKVSLPETPGISNINYL